MLFRSKVKSKFNPQVTKILVNNKGKESVKPTYISSLPHPFWQKHLKKSMRFQNISRRIIAYRGSLMLRLLSNLRILTLL